MTHLAVSVLGSFHVRLDGTDITPQFRTDKERALLIYLLHERERPRQRQALAELLWPNRPEGPARTNLRQALAGLRRSLGDRDAPVPFLRVDNETVRWNPEAACRLDAHDFLARMQSVQRHTHSSLDTCPVCIPQLEEAVDLYQDDFLLDIFVSDSADFQEWVIFTREHYFRLLLTALQALCDWRLSHREYEQAFKHARRLVNLAPLEESAHRTLMRLHALTDHRSAALEQYATLSQLLEAELGAQPNPETTRLYEGIRSGKVAGALAFDVAQADGLPVALTQFVGREQELQWLSHGLSSSSCRLLSITGLPGSGKTRLAYQGGSLNARYFSDGVHLVSLPDAAPGESLVVVIARTLKLALAREQNAVDQVVHYLRARNALLIIDGLECQLDQAWLLVEILRRAPGVKIIATTRQRLNYHSACLLDLSGLPFPCCQDDPAGQDTPAVQLYRLRAERSKTVHAHSPKCYPAMVRIAQLTGGLPLALELAAAHLRELSCPEIAAALEADLGLLSAEIEDVPLRQRSLPQLLQEVVDALPAPSRQAFANLSVFASSFDQAAAQAVTGVEPAVLADLALHALLERPSPQRYVWPRLAQRFAASLLSHQPDEQLRLRDRHARFYQELLHTAISGLRQGRESLESLAWLEPDLPNVSLALTHGLAHKFASIAQSLLELQFYEQSSSGQMPSFFPPAGPQAQCGECINLTGAEADDCALLNGEVCCLRQVTFDDLEQALLLVDSRGRLVDANYQAVQLSGYPRDLMLSQPFDNLVQGQFPAGVVGEFQAVEAFLGHHSGCHLPVQMRWERLEFDEQAYFLLVLRPLGECQDAPDQPLTKFDPLTGLLNREGFRQLVNDRLAQDDGRGARFGIFLLQIDNLRRLQQERGQAQADQILQIAASRLQSCIRAVDHAALVGVDEFALLLSPLPPAAAVDRIIQRLLTALEAPYLIGGEPVAAAVSLGVCFYPECGPSYSALMAHADSARSQAHNEGSNRYKIFSPSL
jgi:diguanylate cyclase (GGDEF)-like protein